MICSKQRKGGYGSNHRWGSEHISADIGKRPMLRNLEIGRAAKNLDKAGFLLDLFRNLWYNVKCRIINSKNEY